MKPKPSRADTAFQITPDYLLAAVLGWLFPGAGHWILGYRVRALLLGATLLGTFWVGESVLADNLAVTRTVHPVFFCLQVGNGFSAILADRIWGEPVDKEDQLSRIRYDLPRHLNLGILFSSVSGLLNLLVVLHLLDPRTWREAQQGNGDEASAETA